MTTNQINRILRAISSDISGRNGLGDVWDSIEDDIRKGILKKWRLIIKNELLKNKK